MWFWMQLNVHQFLPEVWNLFRDMHAFPLESLREVLVKGPKNWQLLLKLSILVNLSLW